MGNKFISNKILTNMFVTYKNIANFAANSEKKLRTHL